MIIEPDTFPPEETPQPPSVDPLLARDITLAVNLAFCKTVCMMVAHNTIGRSAEPQKTAEMICSSFRTHLQSHIALPDHAVPFADSCAKGVVDEIICPFVKKTPDETPATTESPADPEEKAQEVHSPVADAGSENLEKVLQFPSQCNNASTAGTTVQPDEPAV